MRPTERKLRDKIIAILLTVAMVPTLVPSISWAAPVNDSAKAVQSQDVNEKGDSEENSKKAEAKEEKAKEETKAAKEESKEEAKEETKAEPKATEAPKEETKAEEPKEETKEETQAEEPKSEEPQEETQEEESKPEEQAESSDEQKETEATEEEETPEEEEEVKYPAQDFEKSSGGVTIRVHAPKGALPENTSLKVEGVSEDSVKAKVQAELGEDATVITAKDLTFNHDGDRVEPKDGKNLSVTFVYDKFAGINSLGVLHINKNGTAEKISCSAGGNQVQFEADEFSAYVIADTGAKEEEVLSPAQDFEGSDGGVTVKVHAPEGALPDGTEMKVSAVSAKSVEGEV